MARTIDVCWHAQEDGRGWYNSTAMLNDAFDQYDCRHHGAWNKMPDVDGAVVVVHGGRELERFDKLQSDIERLKWCLVIYLGDEECNFLAEKIEHPNMLAWVQEPLPGRHDFAKRFMVNGYGHDHARYIVKCEKDLDWFFGGQVTHDRRRAVVDALRTMDWGGFIIETRGYHQGVSLEEYYRCLCRAKIVPCPSGPCSPDAARIWDILECGGIPILDDLSPTRPKPGFWNYVLGPHPLPVVTNWVTLPEVIDELKNDWIAVSSNCQWWWHAYQMKFRRWLADDIEQLTGEPCTKNSSRS